MIEQLIAHLLADDAIAALVGIKVTHEFREPMPSISVQKAGGVSQVYLDGTLRPHEGRYQVDCWGNTSAQTNAVKRAVLASINTFVGDMQGRRVLLARCDSDIDLSELEGDRKTRRISLDFDIMHEE